MSARTLRTALALGASLVALLSASSASAAVIHGVVVSHNARAHSFVVAQRRGKLVSIHARRSPALGRVVAVRAKELRDGTFAVRHVQAGRQIRHRTLIHGVVTFVNRGQREFTVSAGGASLLVHARRAAGQAADAASGSSLPSVGDEVTVETQIDDQGDLEDQGVQQTGTATQNIDVEGTILSIDNTPGTTVDGTATSGTLTLSADGEDDTTQSITVAVPSTMDISMFQVGQEVELTVSVLSDRSFLLQGSSEDGNSSQANNPGDQQGCDGEDQSGSTSCGQSGGDGSDSQGGDGSSGSGSSGDGSSTSSGSDSSTSSGSDSSTTSGSDSTDSSSGSTS